MHDFWGQYWWLIVIGVVWEVIWKAFALWKAAKHDDKIWFIVLLILNTAGILEIFYIFVFSKRNDLKQEN